MVRDVLTVTPDTTVEETCALGQKHSIGTFPVVNEQKEVMGIITTAKKLRYSPR